MARITVTTNECEVVEIIDTAEYDLDRSIARAGLIVRIMDALATAAEMETESKMDDKRCGGYYETKQRNIL